MVFVNYKMLIQKAALDSILLDNVCEIRFPRRIIKKGQAATRRMICTKSLSLLNSVNGRVSFNYETAHIFFLFFFIPYANNIGIYFDEFPKDTLKLIMKTTVMSAISNQNLIKDL